MPSQLYLYLFKLSASFFVHHRILACLDDVSYVESCEMLLDQSQNN
jgi:hypothetical protein